MKDRYFKYLAITIVAGVFIAIFAPARAAAETLAARPAIPVARAYSHPHHHHHHHHHRRHRRT